jgi:hypothetical protein
LKNGAELCAAVPAAEEDELLLVLELQAAIVTANAGLKIRKPMPRDRVLMPAPSFQNVPGLRQRAVRRSGVLTGHGQGSP